MTELAALNIRITGDSGDLKAAVSQATGELGKIAPAAAAANRVTGALTGGLGRLGAMSDQTRNSLRGASQQLSQVGQQTMATGNFVQALAIQLPDLGLAFGAVGAAAGLLAGVALPLLVSMFGEAEGKVRDFDAAIGDVENSIAAMNERATRLSAEGLVALKEKYGEVNAELLRFVELQTEAARVDALNNTREAMAALQAGFDGWFSSTSEGLAELFDKTEGYGRYLEILLNKAQNARTFDGQLAALTELREKILKATGGVENMTAAQYEFYRKVMQSEDALRQLVATQPRQGWLSVAIGAAETLAGRLWNAVSAQAALNREAAAAGPGMDTGSADWAKTDLGFTKDGADLIYTPPSLGVGGSGGGGGGGGGENPIIAKLEALQTALMGQEQAQIDSYMRQQETLDAALAQRLITQQEYNALMEEAQRQHQEAMSAIDVWRYGDSLQKMGAFMGGMAEAFQGGNERMQKAARAFGAVEALINAWRAYTQTLADPSLPFFAKFIAGAKVLAAGMGAVNAIRGSGGGAGGAASASAATAGGGGVTEMRTANINFYGGFQPTASTISMIANGLNDWLGDGGRLNVGTR